MNKKNLFALAPVLLISASVFASPSPTIKNSKVESATTITRNNFIDYSIGGENDFSYTCAIELEAIKPMPTMSLGHLGYVSDGSDTLISGSSISPDQSPVMALYGLAVISSKDKGLLLRFEGRHYNKSPTPKVVETQTDSFIFLNDIFSKTDADNQYSSMAHLQTQQQTNLYVSLAGYSLQFRKTFLQTYFGVSYSQLNYTAAVTATNDAFNTTDTQSGSQSTIGGGLFAEIEAGVILYESNDSAFMIISRFRQGSEALHNTGYLSKSSTDNTTEAISQSHNSKLDTCSYSFYNDNRLALSYVSKPNTTDPTYFSIELGVMSLLEQGKDLLYKKGHDAPGDFHTPGVYLRLSFTM